MDIALDNNKLGAAIQKEFEKQNYITGNEIEEIHISCNGKEIRITNMEDVRISVFVKLKKDLNKKGDNYIEK